MDGLRVGQAYGVFQRPGFGLLVFSPQILEHPTCICDTGVKWQPFFFFFSFLSTLNNFLLFFREARDLLNNFVTLYVDGNSSFLDKTFQGTFLPLEVVIHFFLESESKVDLVLCFYCSTILPDWRNESFVH